MGQRLLIMLLTLWAISIAIFLLVQVLPGNIAQLRLGPYGTPEQLRAIEHQLGLDRSVVAQYLSWGHGVITAHWGDSWSLRVPLLPLVMHRLGNSVVLAGLAFVVIVPVSIAAGIIAATHKGRYVDQLLSYAGVVGLSIPEFVSSMILILAFSLWIPLLPSSVSIPPGGSPLDNLSGMVMPVLALTFVLFGYISRTVRASMVVELDAGYTRTAVMNGLPPAAVVWGSLRNALLPAITVIANQVAWLIGGLVVVESVFNYPGIGNLLLTAGLNKDVPMLEVTTLIMGAIILVVNFVAELLYEVADPRLRRQRKSKEAAKKELRW